ncbi:hypothetical protein [Metabacillus indicus]|nr:hypothetical protein [Metabacillus indicus]
MLLLSYQLLQTERNQDFPVKDVNDTSFEKLGEPIDRSKIK